MLANSRTVNQRFSAEGRRSRHAQGNPADGPKTRGDLSTQCMFLLFWESTLMLTRWLVFHVASGQSFFAGVACLTVAVCLSARKDQRYIRSVRNALVCLGGMLVFVSATPLPPWF